MISAGMTIPKATRKSPPEGDHATCGSEAPPLPLRRHGLGPSTDRVILCLKAHVASLSASIALSLECGAATPSVARAASTRTSRPSPADDLSGDDSLDVSRSGINTYPANHRKPAALKTRPPAIVPGNCSSATCAQEPPSQVALAPDPMYWLHGCLQHDYHPAYDKETITNDPEIDE